MGPFPVRRPGLIRGPGDLACKKIFPSLQALVKRGKLEAPVIGVAKSDWILDKIEARAKRLSPHDE